MGRSCRVSILSLFQKIHGTFWRSYRSDNDPAECCRHLSREIIGLAGDKDEAVDMVVEIIQEVYDATGDFRIEEYWKNR